MRFLVILLLLGFEFRAEPVRTRQPAQPQTWRERVVAFADTTVGIREATGRNDGQAIDDILASVGMRGSRAPWCAAYVTWVGDKVFGRSANPYPRSAWSPDHVARPTWVRGKGRTPQPGDTFGIWFAGKKRIAHTGLVRRDLGNAIETLEGNTSAGAEAGSAADREGQGVFRRRRLKSQVHSVRDWISE